MKPYKSSNIVPISGYQWLALATVIAGGVVGGITSFIGNFLYLIILFPLGMGFLGGGATHIAVKKGKVRNPAIAALFGALTGISIYGAMHVFDYWTFQRSVAGELRQAYSEDLQTALAESEEGVTEEDLLQLAIDTILIEETGQAGFIGYLQFTAQQGMELSRSSSGGIPVSGIGMWIYRALELTVIAGVSTAAGFRAAKEPFCEISDRWYGDPQRVGNVDDDRSQKFIGFLDSNNYVKAGELINTHLDIPIPSLEVYLQSPPQEGMADSVVTLSKTSLNKDNKLELKQVLMGMVSPRELKQLQDSIPQSAQTPTNDPEANNPVDET
ncbi:MULTISPECIES: hypothetical protein [unclassified Roseofilum]|uniref:hypothetical protein n=1 Tax=unclassified Roseofilum TaxID=2620099 RepID=UPI001B13363F|nr:MULTISPECIES: hypothetical protein [unclassified Roseofilum]MBP0010424.1 hypothetical protein [Roseofilum sp. Belize Diploria]MBP0034797.1 hypothetical protein [Roseofilum sp. Belize BBD 4]